MASVNPKPVRPTVRLPDDKIADIGKVRFGDGTITGEFAAVRRPGSETADSGTVRLGDGTLTGVYQSKR